MTLRLPQNQLMKSFDIWVILDPHGKPVAARLGKRPAMASAKEAGPGFTVCEIPLRFKKPALQSMLNKLL